MNTQILIDRVTSFIFCTISLFFFYDVYPNTNKNVNFLLFGDSRMKVQQFFYKGHEFWFSDLKESSGIDILAFEFQRNDYRLEDYKFNKGDVIIDVGANIGFVSIILAKLNPDVMIYAFEPCLLNFINLKRNIVINKVTSNVKAFNFAVTNKTGQIIEIFDLSLSTLNSGNSTLYPSSFYKKNQKTKKNMVETISLDDIFLKNNISTCSLLKIDCEGAEFEILYSSEKLKNGFIKNLVGEFHTSNFLTEKGYSIEHLLSYCNYFVMGNVSVHYDTVM